MKKSNYAFVSALYASKTKGLYSETPRYGILIRDLQKLNETLKEINEEMKGNTKTNA